MKQLLERLIMQKKGEFRQHIKVGLDIRSHQCEENRNRLNVNCIKINRIVKKTEADCGLPGSSDDRIPNVGNGNAVPEGGGTESLPRQKRLQ